MRNFGKALLIYLVLAFTITITPLSLAYGTTDLSFIPNKIEVPIITKDATVSEERKMYCEKLLERYTEILKKDYSQLTEEEIETLELLNYLFIKTGTCIGYLWYDFIEEFKGFNKLSKDKVSILLDIPDCGIYSCSKTNLIDLIPMLEKITNCQGKTPFDETIKCITKSNVNIWKRQVPSTFTSGASFLVLFTFKQKYKNSIDLYVFKPYFIFTYRVTPERFEGKYKNFQKNPTMPLCRFYYSGIDCPYFHLEKSFNLIYNPVYFSEYSIHKDAKEFLFLYVLHEDLEKWKKNNSEKNSIELHEKFKNEIKSKELHKDLVLFEKEYKRIYSFPQDANICPMIGKFITVKSLRTATAKILGIDTSYLVGVILNNTPQCRNIFDEELKTLFYHTKTVFGWMEKEFALRGYLK